MQIEAIVSVLEEDVFDSPFSFAASEDDSCSNLAALGLLPST